MPLGFPSFLSTDQSCLVLSSVILQEMKDRKMQKLSQPQPAWQDACYAGYPNHKSECHAHAVISNQSFALAVFKFHLSLNFVPATFLVRYHLVWLWFRGLSLHQFSLSTIDDRILHTKKGCSCIDQILQVSADLFIPFILFPVSLVGLSFSLWQALAWLTLPFLIYRQIVVCGLLVTSSFSELARLHHLQDCKQNEKRIN